MADKLIIDIPEGYSGIDTEKSDFDNGIIVFKKKALVPWRDAPSKVTGFYINSYNGLKEQDEPIAWIEDNRNIFASEKQAKSMQAMAELSQIIANDERFGKPFTDKEWDDNTLEKYVIERFNNRIELNKYCNAWYFLAFRTPEQRDLFYKENEDLIKQYYMLD